LLGPLLAALLCAAPAAKGAPAAKNACVPPGCAREPSALVAPEERAGKLLEKAPPAAKGVVDAARETERFTISQSGEIDAERVRRRLGALTAVATVARPLWRSQDLEASLFAHLALAHAGHQFASELYAGKAPQAARGEASHAWAEQVDRTVRAELASATGHLRSCAALAQNAKLRPDIGAVCEDWLKELRAESWGSGEQQLAAMARARLPELQGCFDAWVSDHPASAGAQLVGRLSIDSVGRVERSELGPLGSTDALAGCLSEALSTWVFAGVADAEIELPLRIQPGR
jgi:hypothetical protein